MGEEGEGLGFLPATFLSFPVNPVHPVILSDSSNSAKIWGSSRNGSRPMEAEMRFSHVIESLDPTLGEGWARASLLIGESPFWHGESRANFEWTWIDFLEWLSCSWAALWLEEGWPIHLPMALHPGQLLDLAREVWVDLPDEEAAWQERELLAYLDRHDLSRGMPGAFLPSILLARSGNTIWVDPEEGEATRCDFRTLIDSLEAVGDALAGYFKDSDDDRVKSVLDHWRNRHEAIRRDYLRYKSGMTKQRLDKLSAWFTETGRQM